MFVRQLLLKPNQINQIKCLYLISINSPEIWKIVGPFSVIIHFLWNVVEVFTDLHSLILFFYFSDFTKEEEMFNNSVSV